MTYLMETTLPTIIGMGVVSHTTDTMFGRRGATKSGKSSKRKPVTKRVAIRSIGGHTVHKGKHGGTYIIKKGRKIYL